MARYNREWYLANKDRIAERRKQPDVRERVNANARAYYERHKERLNRQRRDRHLLSRYGLTAAAFDEILERQGGCGICGTPTPDGRGWHVDHDHACCPTSARSCGACVRGILCASCNGGIGLLGDSVEVLGRAISYLNGAAR